MLNKNPGSEFYRNNTKNHQKTGEQADINTAHIIRDIETAMNEQAALISEGRALLEAIGDCPKKHQISIIVNFLNTELQSSSERLNELISDTA